MTDGDKPPIHCIRAGLEGCILKVKGTVKQYLPVFFKSLVDLLVEVKHENWHENPVFVFQ